MRPSRREGRRTDLKKRYTRVLEYEGGAHVFSDGSDVFHSDFMSGWRQQDLQEVLDECDNDSEAAVSLSGRARATLE